MISPMDVGILDLNCEHLGIDVSKLMEAAGRSLAEEISSRYDSNGTITFLIGPGNNGGDGCVAARYLHDQGISTRLLLSKDPSSFGTDLAVKAFNELPADVEVIIPHNGKLQDGVMDMISDTVILVDALLGAGSKGAPRGMIEELVELSGSVDALRISVDSPTGMGYEGSFKADLTVTFHDVKEGMTSNRSPVPECGEIVIRDIGIPKEASTHIGPGDLLRYPVKAPDAHKGGTGKVLVIGGGPFTGAVVLAAIGASRAGSDLVRVAVPRGVFQSVAQATPDIIASRMDTIDPYVLGPEVLPELEKEIQWCHTVLIGPGAGRSRPALHLLKEAVDTAVRSGKKIVIDADGLTAISELGLPDIDDEHEVLLTPHRNELISLLFSVDEEGSDYTPPAPSPDEAIKWSEVSNEMMARFIKGSKLTVLGKGPVDVIAGSGDHSLQDHIKMNTGSGTILARFNTSGVPQMSVGGTGDILSGLAAGLMSIGLGSFDAACLAAYINGEAGERSFQELGHSLSASCVLSKVRILPP